MSIRSFTCRYCQSAASSSRRIEVDGWRKEEYRRHTLPPRHDVDSRSFSSSAKRSLPRSEDHYGSLKLPKNATKQQIKAKFYELSKKTHPDAPGGSADKFHEINEAYEILGDEAKRRQYDLSLSTPSIQYTQPGGFHNPAPTHSPYSDPYNRRSGPHGGWSTRRPPPKAPPTGHGHYSAFGRHTPGNYGGATGGTYGDPFANAREQFRQGFQDVRSGRNWNFREFDGATGASGRKSKYTGNSPGGERGDVHGSDLGRVMGTVLLVLIVVLLGGSATAKADHDEATWQKVRRYEKERIIKSLGRDEEAG